jgi:cellobiose phosphorylase
LKEQLSRRRVSPPLIPVLSVNKSSRSISTKKLAALPLDLQFFNGYGGFTAAGDEYIIRLTEGVSTPAPWVNVLANPSFGTLVSESGQGYTWIENAHEFRLTPWDNDPLRARFGHRPHCRVVGVEIIKRATALDTVCSSILKRASIQSCGCMWH